MTCDYISPSAEWTNLILKIGLEIPVQENHKTRAETDLSIPEQCLPQTDISDEDHSIC